MPRVIKKIIKNNRLPNIAMDDLKNMRTALRLSVKLEYESWIWLGANAQIQLHRRAAFLAIPSDTNPPLVNITSLRLHCTEIHLHYDISQQIPTVQPTHHPSPTCIDRNLQDRVLALPNEFVDWVTGHLIEFLIFNFFFLIF